MSIVDITSETTNYYLFMLLNCPLVIHHGQRRRQSHFTHCEVNVCSVEGVTVATPFVIECMWLFQRYNDNESRIGEFSKSSDKYIGYGRDFYKYAYHL